MCSSSLEYKFTNFVCSTVNYVFNIPGMYDGIGAYDSLSHVDRYTKSVEKASHFLKACLDADKVLGDSIQFEALK